MLKLQPDKEEEQLVGPELALGSDCALKLDGVVSTPTEGSGLQTGSPLGPNLAGLARSRPATSLSGKRPSNH